MSKCIGDEWVIKKKNQFWILKKIKIMGLVPMILDLHTQYANYSAKATL